MTKISYSFPGPDLIDGDWSAISPGFYLLQLLHTIQPSRALRGAGPTSRRPGLALCLVSCG
jgi:hypothetical protein